MGFLIAYLTTAAGGEKTCKMTALDCFAERSRMNGVRGEGGREGGGRKS